MTKIASKRKWEYFKHWCKFHSNQDGNNDRNKHQCNHHQRTNSIGLCIVWKCQRKWKYYWLTSTTSDQTSMQSTYSQLQMLSQTSTQHSVQHTQHSKQTVLWLLTCAALLASGWSTARFILSLFPDCGCVCIGSKSVVRAKWGRIKI